MRTVRQLDCKAALCFLIVALLTHRGLAAEVTPADWPNQCRWPDRTLEDGKKVNLRPLFGWLAQQEKGQEVQSQGSVLRNTPISKLTERELRELKTQEANRKAQGAGPKPNPMPFWILLSCKAYSTKGAEATVAKLERVVVGGRKTKIGSTGNVGGFYGAGGVRDASIPIYETTEKPIVVFNHPASKTWMQGEKILAFYALWIGQREIEWQGQKTTVDVYDHGKTEVAN